MRLKSIMFVTLLTCALTLLFTAAFTASTGNIKGLITDKETGDPVIGVSVAILGTTMGAQTDLDGRYAILKMEPGKYTLRITSVQHATVEVKDVTVHPDLTTEVNQALEKRVGDLDKTITVMGKVDIIDKMEVAHKLTLNSNQIQTRPVSTVDDILHQVAGVQTTATGEVFIRGGRAGEVSYIIDGVPVGDPLGGCAPIIYSPPQSVTPWPPVNGGSAIVNGEPYSAMFFEHYGVNPFVDTEDDHLSTFAIDVDDASYNMARSYLNDGHYPPSKAIRVEEFINSFDYDYEPPRHDPFSATIEGAPSRFGTPSTYLLRIGIKGKEIQPEDRKAANLVFVIDVSGSMNSGNRLGLVKRALLMLVNGLTQDDRVGIVVYGSQGRIVYEPGQALDKRAVRRAIKRLSAEGATYAEQGIRLGYEMADRMFDADKINRVILCSDGVANVGQTSPDQILKIIKKYADKGVTLSAIGFGMGNYNDVLMEQLGDKGNGTYAYVDDLKEVRKVFVENLTGTLQVIAREVKIQVDFNPEVVRSYRLIGFENRNVADKDFRNDTVDGGEIGSGHECTALYEVKLHPGVTRERMATLFVRLKNPDNGKFEETSYPISSGVLSRSFANATNTFKLATAVAEFAEILRDSYWARESNLNDVKRLAEQVYEETASEDVEELIRLIDKANQFKKLAER